MVVLFGAVNFKICFCFRENIGQIMTGFQNIRYLTIFIIVQASYLFMLCWHSMPTPREFPRAPYKRATYFWEARPFFPEKELYLEKKKMQWLKISKITFTFTSKICLGFVFVGF